jgi:hypothetical protein
MLIVFYSLFFKNPGLIYENAKYFRLLVVALLASAGSCGLTHGPRHAVRYNLAFPNAVHHEARITATFSDVPAGQVLHVRMARSSPGRYAVHDFAKNVYYVLATDAADKPWPLPSPTVRLGYKGRRRRYSAL